MTTEHSTEIRPFRLEIPDAEIADLHDRLSRTRWADDPVPSSWTRGVPIGYLQGLADYWRHDYDWRRQEAALNQLPQFTTTTDGENLHFVHLRSSEPDAVPLLLAHGYPTSSIEFLKIITPLTEPWAHGGDRTDAFHVVAPSIPGFGLSNPVVGQDWDMARTAGTFAELMQRLGYSRYGLHGGDIGAGIVGQLAVTAADRVIGVHVTSDPGSVAAVSEHMPLPDLAADDRARLDQLRAAWEEQKGYLVLQSNRPQTMAHALTDSPVAQLAWIVDYVKEWTNPAADLPEDAVNLDQLLTNITLYWFTRSGASAARFLYATAHSTAGWVGGSTVPQGWAVFNADGIVRRLMDPNFEVEHWSEFTDGGHFPAMEVPELLIRDIQNFFRKHR
jgi:pimeloyl-ACP methyl ester carboxylesterase